MSHRCHWGAVHPNTIAADIGSVIATARRRAITRTLFEGDSRLLRNLSKAEK